MKQWKCAVCAHLHDGKEPPEACPSCGATMYQFILNAVLPDELNQRLKEAFAGESQAFARNQAYSRRAFDEGYPQVGMLFKAVALAEKVHADEYLKYLEGVVGATEENLKRAFESEIKVKQDIYPALVRLAFQLGRDDVAWSFIRARDVEERHAALYKDALQALVNERDVTYHVCPVCGYVFDQEPPEECPICRCKRKKFRKIT
jgi:rubrerythrin